MNYNAKIVKYSGRAKKAKEIGKRFYRFAQVFVHINGDLLLSRSSNTKLKTNMSKDISIFTLCSAMEALCNSLKNGGNPQELSIPDMLKSPLFSETDILVMAWLENHRYEDHSTEEICADLKISLDTLDACLSHLEVKNILVWYTDTLQEINLAGFFAGILDHELKSHAKIKRKPGSKAIWETFIQKQEG